MSKIAKFLNLALKNSMAGEAAQALKMAAMAMQAEGVNPASLLQEKGANSGSTALVASLQREVSSLKTDYNGMVEKYNNCVRSHKARGERIAELEALVRHLRVKANHYQEEAEQPAAPRASGAYADILNEVNQKKEGLAYHPKALKLKAVWDNIESIKTRFAGLVFYSAPDGDSRAFKYGHISIGEAYGRSTYCIEVHPDNGYENFILRYFIRGARGAHKDTLTWAFNTESELMRFLFSRSGVLK